MDQALIPSTQDADSPHPHYPVNSNCETSSVRGDEEATEEHDPTALPSIDKGKGKARAQSPEYEIPRLGIMDLLAPRMPAITPKLGEATEDDHRILADAQRVEHEAEQEIGQIRKKRDDLWKQMKTVTTRFSRSLRKKFKALSQGIDIGCNIEEIMHQVVLESTRPVHKQEEEASDTMVKSREASPSSKICDSDPAADVNKDQSKAEGGGNIDSGETDITPTVLQFISAFSVLHRDHCRAEMNLAHASLRRAEVEIRVSSGLLGLPTIYGLDDPLRLLDGIGADGEDMDDPDLVLAKMLSMEENYDADFLQSIGTSSSAKFSDLPPLYDYPTPSTNVSGSSVQSSSQPPQVPV